MKPFAEGDRAERTGLAPNVATVIRPVGVPPGYCSFKVTVKSTLDCWLKDTDDGDTVSKMLVVAWSTVSDSLLEVEAMNRSWP